MELGACFAPMAGDHCLGAVLAHHGGIMDLGIILANDRALVGNSRFGGLDTAASDKFT